MTRLRERMIAAMRQRGFSVRTHQSYLHAVTELAGYYRRPPDALDVGELQRFFGAPGDRQEAGGASPLQ